MIGNFIDMNNCRVLVKDYEKPEIRFINNKTGDVYFKELTDQECMDIAYFFHKLVGNCFDGK